MTSYLAGAVTSPPLTVQWSTGPGGSATDVTGLTITIKTTGGTTVLAATSTGITHLATGLYAYAWAIPADQVGEFVSIWDATDSDSDAVQTSEVFTVLAVGESWPPVLAEMKTDLGKDQAETGKDAQYQQVLDAAVYFVERIKAGRYDFSNGEDSGSDALPAPTADLRLGTLRLAGRWHTRRRSPDGLIAMAEMGSARVPAFDADIERLLGIGRYVGPVIA